MIWFCFMKKNCQTVLLQFLLNFGLFPNRQLIFFSANRRRIFENLHPWLNFRIRFEKNFAKFIFPSGKINQKFANQMRNSCADWICFNIFVFLIFIFDLIHVILVKFWQIFSISSKNFGKNFQQSLLIFMHSKNA